MEVTGDEAQRVMVNTNWMSSSPGSAKYNLVHTIINHHSLFLQSIHGLVSPLEWAIANGYHLD